MIYKNYGKFTNLNLMSERKILGVCAWLADKFGLDLGGLRILFVAASIFGFGSPIIIYFILYLLKPSNY